MQNTIGCKPEDTDYAASQYKMLEDAAIRMGIPKTMLGDSRYSSFRINRESADRFNAAFEKAQRCLARFSRAVFNSITENLWRESRYRDALKNYKAAHGIIPGSNTTKRLRKKQRTAVMKSKFYQPNPLQFQISNFK